MGQDDTLVCKVRKLTRSRNCVDFVECHRDGSTRLTKRGDDEPCPQGPAQRPFPCGSYHRGFCDRSLTSRWLSSTIGCCEWVKGFRAVRIVYLHGSLKPRLGVSPFTSRHQHFTALRTRARTSLRWAGQSRTSSRTCECCWRQVRRAYMSMSGNLVFDLVF